MQIHFLGCGDAFGSGGRFNTCFHVTGLDSNFLIDCGASSLIALKKAKIELNKIQSILITHFHADHFGGLPFLMLDAQFLSKRTEPLTIAGPHGLKDWFERAMETAFPGSSSVIPKFELTLIELVNETSINIGTIHVTPFLVNHGEPGGPFFAYRLLVGGKTIAYTGDTQWTDSIINAGKNANLFIAEAYFLDKQVPLHLDLATLQRHLPDINAKRVVLTHMSESLLNQLDSVSIEVAHDGLVVQVE